MRKKDILIEEFMFARSNYVKLLFYIKDTLPGILLGNNGLEKTLAKALVKTRSKFGKLL